MTTPEDGHTWRFTASARGSYSVVGGPKHDADWWSEPWIIEVRAWSLPEALRRAAELPLTAWSMPVEDEYPDEELDPEAVRIVAEESALAETRRWAQDQAIEGARSRRWEDVKAERRKRDDDYTPEAVNRTADDD